MSEISDLMGKDPLHLTVEDRGKIIAEIRAGRERFMTNVKAPKAEAAAKPKAEKKSKITGLSLDDLDI